MKSVLISLKPQWCEEVALLKKTDELRKNAPKLPTPFKVLIYQTRHRWIYKMIEPLNSLRWARTIIEGQQKVIGEFFCTRITPVTKDNREALSETSCVPLQDMYYYAGDKSIYDLKAWHISALKIYDKPKNLSDFIIPSKIGCCNEGKCRGCTFLERGNVAADIEDDCTASFDTDEYKPLRRPSQSWCYVEELK